MEVKKEKPSCFGNYPNCSEEKAKDCTCLINCLMSLYDRPPPKIILYSSDLVER